MASIKVTLSLVCVWGDFKVNLTAPGINQLIDHLAEAHSIDVRNQKIQVEMPGGKVGDLGKCRSCNADVAFVTEKTGKRPPYDLHGVTHFGSCPDSERWRGQSARGNREASPTRIG